MAARSCHVAPQVDCRDADTRPGTWPANRRGRRALQFKVDVFNVLERRQAGHRGREQGESRIRRSSRRSTRSRLAGRRRAPCASWCNTTDTQFCRNCCAPGLVPGALRFRRRGLRARTLGDHAAWLAARRVGQRHLLSPGDSGADLVRQAGRHPQRAAIWFDAVVRRRSPGAPGLHTIGGMPSRDQRASRRCTRRAADSSNRLEASDAPPRLPRPAPTFRRQPMTVTAPPVPDGGSIRLLEKRRRTSCAFRSCGGCSRCPLRRALAGSARGPLEHDRGHGDRATS